MPKTTQRSFHFGTREYAACFAPLPTPDPSFFRQQAVNYLENTFDSTVWYERPVCSLLKGERLTQGNISDTTNALGEVNGKQIWSTPQEWEALRQHILTYKPPVHDLRNVIRQVEEDLFTNHSGALIGHQCLDFAKQDGVTEVEEAVMANTVERRLNDLLIRDETQNVLSIDRKPIYVACVSNFSNFLDLSRKTLRSLEVGIPVVILGRSHTSQHVFRWVELLQELAADKIDTGMITYLSGSVEDLSHTLQNCPAGNLYATCSRDLAATLKATYPKTIASTGGPNTLVVTSNIPNEKDQKKNKDAPTDSLTRAVQDAIRISATIESAGQCTALRHCVVPTDTSDETLEALWSATVTPDGPAQALQAGKFDGVFTHTATPLPPDNPSDRQDVYQHPSERPQVAYKIASTLPVLDPPMNEYWRQVAVDFTKLDLAKSAEDRQALCTWLNTAQPISLAINGPRNEAFDVGLKLFDHTGLVVYTLGSTDATETMPAALTCQARPQDAECFGEFPPRNAMQKYSMFPVVIPSSNPSYGATYTDEYLTQQTMDTSWSAPTQALLEAIQDPLVRGYAMTVIRYLQDVDKDNPHFGRTAETRTTLWGLQRPPLHQAAHVYVPDTTSWDAVAPLFLLYYVTTARSQMVLTVHPDNKGVQELLDGHDIGYHVTDQADWQAQCDLQAADVFFSKVVTDQDEQSNPPKFCMAGLFALQHLPAGHIKSTAANDDEFLLRFKGLSKKWLSTLF